jgi:flagellar motor switch protein FliN/FliY
MDIGQVKSMLTDNFGDISEILKQSFNQLFGREAEFSQTVLDETNTIITISEENYPKLHISFKSTGKVVIKHLVVMDPQLGLNLFAWMIGDEPETEIGDEHIEGLQEAANQLFGQVQAGFEADGTSLKIDELDIKLYKSVEEAIGTIEEEEGSVSTYKAMIGEEFELKHFVWFDSTLEDDSKIEQSIEDDLFSGLDEELTEKVNVNPTSFQDFGAEKVQPDEPRKIDMLLDVNLEAIVELGRKSIPIKDVLQLGRGSIIELNKTAGEPLDIYVNNKKLAEGEVVVVDERFGIRITHLVDPKQRLQNLK